MELMSRAKYYILSSKRPKRPAAEDSIVTTREKNKAIKTFNDDADVALSVIMSLLGTGVRTRVDDIYSNRELSSRIKVIRVLKRIEDEYVPPSAVTVNLFKKMMDNIESIPSHVSDSAAAVLIEETLTEITSVASQLALSNPNEKYSDDSLVAKFFDKVGTHKLLQPFRTTHALLQSHGTVLSFTHLCKSVRNELISMGFVNLGRVARTASSVSNTGSSSSVVPDTSATLSSLVAMTKGFPSKSHGASSVVSSSFTRSCWN